MLTWLLTAAVATAAVVQDLESMDHPGSGAWDQYVAFRLAVEYDRNRSGDLDKKREIEAISCEVWAALDSQLADTQRYPGLLIPYGFRSDLDWVGYTIGFDARMRGPAEAAMRQCGIDEGALPPPASTEPGTADIIDFIAQREHGEASRTLVQIILLASHDHDDSGSIDTTEELAQIDCDVWTAVDGALRKDAGPGIVASIGLVPGEPWRGFDYGLSIKLREPLQAKLGTCGFIEPAASGDANAPTPDQVVAAEVRSILPGTPVWTSRVREMMVERYDADDDKLIDDAGEVAAVPCDVWNALDESLSRGDAKVGFGTTFGFAPGMTWSGDEVGFAFDAREAAWAAMNACP